MKNVKALDSSDISQFIETISLPTTQDEHKSKLAILIEKDGLFSARLYCQIALYMKSGVISKRSREYLAGTITKFTEKTVDSKIQKILSRFPKDTTSSDDIVLSGEYVLPAKKSKRPRKKSYRNLTHFYNRESPQCRIFVTVFDNLRKGIQWSLLRDRLGQDLNADVFEEIKKFYTGEYRIHGWEGNYTKDGDSIFLKVVPTPEWDGDNLPKGGEEDYT